MSDVGRRPDLLLIITDQQRFDQLGFASGGFYDTPNIDRLAARGVRFEHAYSGSTTCVPARISLLTGLQLHQTATFGNGHWLREGFWTVAHGLRAAGYQTAAVGKMHFSPMHADHGFDTLRLSEDLGYIAGSSAVLDEGTDDYGAWLAAQGVADWRDLEPGELFRRDGRWFPYGADLHPTAWIGREARHVLATRDPARPLFLVVSFPQPHPPLCPPDSYLRRYDPIDAPVPSEGFEVNAALPPAFADALQHGEGNLRPWHPRPPAVRDLLTRVRALVKHIDDEIGAIVDGVDLERATVFVTSDHGDFGGHRGLFQKVPWIPFDDLARVMFIAAGKGVASGRVVPEPVQSCDLALTCLDYAGVAAPDASFETRSLRSPLETPAARPNEDRVLMCSAIGWPMVRVGPMKLILHRRTGSSVLFDMGDDAAETRDLGSDTRHRSVVGDLEALLHARLHRPVEQLWVNAPSR
jgi:choline-sulfatase